MIIKLTFFSTLKTYFRGAGIGARVGSGSSSLEFGPVSDQ